MPNGLRIAVLSSRDLVRHGLRGMLRELPVPVYFVDATDPTVAADLIIVDATGTLNDEAEGLEAVTTGEDAPVLVLTSRPPAQGFAEWDQAVHGFVSVSATDTQLVDAVAGALRTSLVARTKRVLTTPDRLSGLSPREVQVLAAIAAGKSNGEIAQEIYLGLNTIKTYIRTAYRKIGVTTRPNAILWALDHGLGRDGIGLDISDQDRRWSGDDPTPRTDPGTLHAGKPSA
ncbi:response regulator transcription factor [Nocardioides dongxiaopingii]|uniref:helix-turn-helix transcriptional regulator n=1 Tax=Nocardioides TaxID=1839 RepID=UPI0010C763C5|nr:MULTISPECIES: response regulator transcription factor [Nocardioides]QCW51625.1 response regulator transcription factor [Nocardioides sp. S-1144]